MNANQKILNGSKKKVTKKVEMRQKPSTYRSQVQGDENFEEAFKLSIKDNDENSIIQDVKEKQTSLVSQSRKIASHEGPLSFK